MKQLLVVMVLTACGDSSAQRDAGRDIACGGCDALNPDVLPNALAITSPSFTEGSAIPAIHTCAGANTSPQLVWTGGPAAQSYAVVLTDTSNNLVHWVIYDIPGSATGLPAAVMNAYAPTNVTGAHQTPSFSAAIIGYNGPCPPSVHTYEFAVFALDVTPLPGTTMATTRAQATPIITQHMLATATLTGTYTP
jgi:hypothetical protein